MSSKEDCLQGTTNNFILVVQKLETMLVTVGAIRKIRKFVAWDWVLGNRQHRATAHAQYFACNIIQTCSSLVYNLLACIFSFLPLVCLPHTVAKETAPHIAAQTIWWNHTALDFTPWVRLKVLITSMAWLLRICSKQLWNQMTLSERASHGYAVGCALNAKVLLKKKGPNLYPQLCTWVGKYTQLHLLFPVCKKRQRRDAHRFSSQCLSHYKSRRLSNPISYESLAAEYSI